MSQTFQAWWAVAEVGREGNCLDAVGTRALLGAGCARRSEADQCSRGEHCHYRILPRSDQEATAPGACRWQKIGAKTKQAFAIGMLDGSQYGFAGLWESWKEENGTLPETFTIITTDPNEVMEPLHDRMPVIIEPKDYDRWLQPADARALPLDLLRPFPAERMRAWKANSRVGKVRNDEEALLICDDTPTLWD